MPTPTTTTPTTRSGLKVKTHVQAGTVLTSNHTQTLTRPTGLKVKTHVQAGHASINHSQTLVQAPHPGPGLKGQTHVEATRWQEKDVW